MYDKFISVESGFLSLVREFHKTQDICEHTVDKYPCTLTSAPNSIKTSKMSEKCCY